MKKLLALLLLFGIVGCTSTTFNPPASQWQNTDDRGLCFTYYSNYGSARNNDFKLMNYTRIINEIDRRNLNCRAFSEFSSKKDWMRNWVSSNAGNSSIKILDVRQARLDSQSTYETSVAKRIHKGAVSESLRYSEDECLNMLSTDIDAYLTCIDNHKKFSRQELNVQFRENKKLKEQKEQQKFAVIKALKERCVTYGFTGDNNIAACVQREAQHDYDIEQKEYELKLAQYQLRAQQNQNQLLAQQSQPQVAPEVPWYLQALEAVALGLAEGIEEGYKQKALIQTMDARYAKKDIYRYCRPNC